MNDHISKPLDPGKMIGILVKWIKPSRPTAVPASSWAEAPQIVEEFPDLPGVNVAAGVYRMGGSVTSYCAILEKFRNSQQNAVTEIHSAIAADDWSKAERLAHTLKGLAGTIGAERLQLKARELETGIRELGATKVELLLPTLGSELAALIAAIDRTLQARTEENSGIACSVPIDLEELSGLIRKASIQLKEFNSSVEGSIARIRNIVKDNPDLKKGLVTIERCVTNYDYEQGLIELTAWAKRLGISCDL